MSLRVNWVIVLLFAPFPLFAQESPAEKPATEEAEKPNAAAADDAAEKPAARPKADEWNKALTAWKKLLVDLRTLREEYVTAEKEEVDRIRKEYADKLAAGETMLAELKLKARDAFVEAPNEDRQLTRFLVKVAADDVKADNYEAAYQISKFLVEAKCEDKNIYNIAGLAAYGSNRFAEAKTYLKQAEEAGSLSKDGEEANLMVDEVVKTWAEEQKFLEKDTKSELPRVKLKTNKGDIVVELFENEAPDTVGNFVSLVEKGFYDGRVFHRVLPGFMAQGGDPNGNGSGGPGYKIYCESRKDPHRNHFAGYLSMAKQPARDTGGSQFFITFKPTPNLNGDHTVFGRVVEGLDVLPKLQRINPEDPKSGAITPDKIVEAEIVRLSPGKKAEDYKPNKVK